MSVRVAINGFGRIGRSVFRIISQREHRDIEVVAINDLARPEQLAYLFKYDSVMGPFPGRVAVTDGHLLAGGQRARMLATSNPAELPWGELGIDVLIESTGVFRDRASLEKHVKQGAKKVILTVPAKDKLDATIVLGVNHHTLDEADVLISNASCTTNCLAPLAKILDDSFGVKRGVMTTVHAYTNDQRLADVPHKDLRRSRAATENIIPTTTGAAKAVGLVLPMLAGKLDGMAMRVPVPDGSIVDLVVELERPVEVGQVNQAVARAAGGDLKSIVQYSEEPLVSTDIIGNPHSCIFDALSTRVMNDRWVKCLAWYDNEWGYANRVVDLVELMNPQAVLR
jgi:glyceraldehyde 3-phosphate dehydrogenase